MEPGILNIYQAIELYELIGECIPEITEETKIPEFSLEILRKIREHNPSAYFSAIALLTGKDKKELRALNIVDLLTLFLHGLAKNKIAILKQFGAQWLKKPKD